MATYTEIQEAKELLKKAGYFTDKLWTVEDVKSVFPDVTQEQAQDILDKSLDNEGTMGQIWFSVREFGRDLYNLKESE